MCCLVDEIPDLLLPVRGGPSRRLDHRGGLHVSQLLQAPLPRHNPAHLAYQEHCQNPDWIQTIETMNPDPGLQKN
jgi:hypothetical protein